MLFYIPAFLYYQVKSENTAVKGRESKPHGIPVEIYDREHYPRKAWCLHSPRRLIFEKFIQKLSCDRD